MAVEWGPLAGLAAGKILRWAFKQFGVPEYKVFGVDVVKTGVGAALVGVSYWYGPRLGRLENVVGYAGAGMIVDEFAKAAGINPSEKKVIKIESPTRSAPAKRTVIVA